VRGAAVEPRSVRAFSASDLRQRSFSARPDVTLDVLWPPATGKYNSNNAGLVLRLNCAGRSILFPADIQEPAERELLKHPEMLRADILVAPHHGSAEGTTPQFVAAVHPMAILASNDGRLTMKQRNVRTPRKRSGRSIARAAAGRSRSRSRETAGFISSLF